MNPEIDRRFNRLMGAVALILFLWLVWAVFSALQTLHTTSLLHITTPDSKATISISSTNTSGRVIGVGHTNVRVHPGTYLIMASNTGKQAMAVETITLGQTVNVKLTPSSQSILPTVDNIQFSGLNNLLSNGLSATQVANLKKLFFTYKPTAKSVAINTSTIAPGYHDPNGSDLSFSLTFAAAIDGNPFDVTVRYADLTNVVLQLVDSTGNQVFSADSAQANSR
jgi:hypothetical protein